uniref:Lin-9 isogeny n=1 Tax=Cajanus cajan TaxID=3821 RepID=A0A151U4Y7_CAJCA|nr:Lin-9 isogeny [Cajanus cajan]
MAPTRKSRSVNKRISSSDDISPEKDGVNSNKNKQRKKKLTDKLGSQWSKEELERFYEAYRKYGKDWKKVAAVVRNRSAEMVEALYNMNRAYLSLPEGTASVVGLVAMMTDHYNVLEGSDSERESNDAPGSRKPVKRKREKVQLSVSKDPVQSHSFASSDDCLSLLKKRCFDGKLPVGKRTPRVLVKKDETENYVSPYRRSLKSTVDANDDEVAHVVALTLTEASQRGGSPQVSQSPYRRVERNSSPVQSWHKMSGTARAKFHDVSADEEFLECSVSVESRGAENGEYARDNSSLMDMEGIGAVEVHHKGEKFYRKRERVKIVGSHQLDDGGEACSGTEEGLSFSSQKEKVDIEVTNDKLEKFSPNGQRKRNKKLFFGDETPSLNALQTLADLSLMMPTSKLESESSIQLKGERMAADKDEKSALREATSISHKKHKLKHCVVPEIEVSTSKKSKLGKELTKTTNALSESKEQLPFADTILKRKRKSMGSKVASAKLDSYPSGPLKDGALDDENKLVVKGKHTDQVLPLPKQLKIVKSSESSVCSEQKDLTVSAAEVPLLNEVSIPTKRSRRKIILQRTSLPKEKSSDYILKTLYLKYNNVLYNLQEKLSSCLSSNMVRRWFIFEWFYSAIDYPWFAKREFMEYLNHVGLGNIPRLTRVEWSVIKSSLGKPRRFSEHFLREERQKLEQYRESVRKHYTELRTGARDGLPTDLARPLYVGQRVIALHPKTREIHDGSVLTVDYDKCRIQFDRPELGVEFVMNWPFPFLKIRKQILLNPQLQRARSLVILPTESSSRRGYRTGEGSSRGRSSRLLDRGFKSDRWVFTMAPPFLVRASSIRSPRVANNAADLRRRRRRLLWNLFDFSPLQDFNLITILKNIFISHSSSSIFRNLFVVGLATNLVMVALDCRETCYSSEHHLSTISSSDFREKLLTCTERQYPPADVAQILDSAVTSLHPCCPRNLPIYREIQMCMGRIKTQILALIPT